jgi:hypothetical protein
MVAARRLNDVVGLELPKCGETFTGNPEPSLCQEEGSGESLDRNSNSNSPS